MTWTNADAYNKIPAKFSRHRHTFIALFVSIMITAEAWSLSLWRHLKLCQIKEEYKVMYWSTSLKNHLKMTPSNLTVTNHLVKNEELLLLVWTGSYHHLTIRSKDIMKNSFSCIYFRTFKRKCPSDQYFLVDGTLLISDSTT